jgi:hypothetical protein
MQKDQRVADMATEALARQVRAYAKQTAEPFEGALKAVLKTEAGRQLGELRNGSVRDKSAQQWQEDLLRKRAEERRRAQQEECSRAQPASSWKSFMKTERQELELRKEGQLAKALGEPLPGEAPEALQRLASEDQKQAEEGQVALMSDGKVFYKHLEGLCEGDMPARIAANRMRMTWLKERQDRRLSYEEG